jgi:hypothetical protein
MITYKITNTLTEQFYIGSAQTFGHYLMRVHNHYHNKRSILYTDFRENPLAFTFEVLKEDDLQTGDFEKELLIQYFGDPLLYNKTKMVAGTHGRIEPPKPAFEDGSRWAKEIKEKMSISQTEDWATNTERKEIISAKMAETNSKKKPCPKCGLLMNAGNLAKHLKGTKCKEV